MQKQAKDKPGQASTVTAGGAFLRRLKALGVRFTMDPVEIGPVTIAVFDDTCGNLIQIQSPVRS